MHGRIRNDLKCVQRILAPGKKKLKAFVKVQGSRLVQIQGTLKHGAVHSFQAREQLGLGGDEAAALEIIEILKNKENGFIGSGQGVGVVLGRAMNVAMADFVIEIIQAHFHEIAHVLLGIGGNKFL